MMLDIVKNAVEQYGAEDFSSETLYDTAISWSFNLDGLESFNSYDQTKRISQNYYAVYELDGIEEDINRVHDAWLPQVITLD